MHFYRKYLLPLLFAIPAETAHRFAIRLMGRKWFAYLLKDYRCQVYHNEFMCAGIRFVNPIGLAAGFDKNGQAIRGLENCGFGFITIGTATLHPRKGNKRPRIARLPGSQGLVDCCGLPNQGIEKVLENINRQRNSSSSTPIFLSIGGKYNEILPCYKRAAAHAEAVEIDMSCPNVMHDTQDRSIGSIEALACELGKLKKGPIFFKLAVQKGLPLKDIALLAHKFLDLGIDGVTLTGLHRVLNPVLSTGSGSLAGAPLFEKTLKMVETIANVSTYRGKLCIIASGGVMTGRDFRCMRDAGADLISIFTAFVYWGPSIVSTLLKEGAAGKISKDCGAEDRLSHCGLSLRKPGIV